MPVSFDNNCSHINFSHTSALNPTPLKMRTCKMQFSVHVKILQNKWLCLFMFRPITLKELNSLISIDTFSCLGGQEVTHPTAVR